MSINTTLELLKDIRHDLANSEMRISNWHKVDAGLGKTINALSEEVLANQQENIKRERRLQNEA